MDDYDWNGTSSAAGTVAASLAGANARSDVNAFIRVNADAVADAEILDQRKEQGEELPLHGWTVAVKDNIDTKGLPTTGGALALSGYVPDHDAECVARLKRAGAIIIGKTNLDELAGSGRTLSSLGGQTLHPLDPERFPAGSSGGSSVAVAVGACRVALGTETVNSIRNPANVCGVFGLRPTLGLVPTSGVIPVSPTMDVVGPLAATLPDLARVTEVLVGCHADSGTINGDLPWSKDALSSAIGQPVAGFRIAVAKGLFGSEPEHEGVNQAIAAALGHLLDQGIEIVEPDDPRFDSKRLYDDLALHPFELHQAFDDWLERLGDRKPIKSFEAYVADGRWPKKTMSALLETALATPDPMQAPAYLKMRQNREALHGAVTGMFQDHRLDALIYPMQHRAALRHDDVSRPERNGILASALGWPALNVPIGKAAGLPVGMDIMAMPFREPLLFTLGHAAAARART
ncbi:amidase [Peteryoungia desertarenae]|uniref:Amidase n=1 Tax=Peteryoungia desertarenae TaxID=1813451 RepID=A0ABX6QN09_9HYPH|nr:amidase [Peteryoungia desertarenae]QLF69918.1 amidase [Peteryoungia desertarenae]